MRLRLCGDSAVVHGSYADDGGAHGAPGGNLRPMPRLPVDVAYHGYAGGVGGFIPPGAFKLPNHTPRPYPAGTVIGRVTGGFQGFDAQGHDAALPAVVETRGTAPVITLLRECHGRGASKIRHGEGRSWKKTPPIRRSTAPCAPLRERFKAKQLCCFRPCASRTDYPMNRPLMRGKRNGGWLTACLTAGAHKRHRRSPDAPPGCGRYWSRSR